MKIHSDWQEPPPQLTLSANYIDIWCCQFAQLATYTDEYYQLLSVDERQRADRLKIMEKREQFIITRGCLRQNLGSLIDCHPVSLKFQYLKTGKPVLAEPATDISFNVSHTQSLALIAMTCKHNIGIDIEKINWQVDHALLIKHYFTATEYVRYRNLTEHMRIPAFYTCWTRKEACIKAMSVQMHSQQLDSFTVDMDIDTDQIEVSWPPTQTCLTAYSLNINPHYKACVVTDSGSKIRHKIRQC